MIINSSRFKKVCNGMVKDKSRYESLPAKLFRWYKICIVYTKYLHRASHDKKTDVVFFIIDPEQKQAGFADRIKAIVNSYEIAKCNNLQFKIYFEHPFPLSRYLIPNEHDWRCDYCDIDKSIFSSRLKGYHYVYEIPKWKNGYQYHILWYRGQDMIRRMCEIDGASDALDRWHNKFKNNFDELFKFSPYLLKLIDSAKLEKRSYISVHLRFVNSIGMFEGNTKKYPILPENLQELLIYKCLTQIEDIKKNHAGMPLYIFSDSERFLNIAQKHGYKVLAGGPIGHIAHSNSDQIQDKAMLDFFVIGRSSKVYSIVNEGMYAGVYSEYAALIGGAPFERIINKEL